MALWEEFEVIEESGRGMESLLSWTPENVARACLPFLCCSINNYSSFEERRKIEDRKQKAEGRR